MDPKNKVAVLDWTVGSARCATICILSLSAFMAAGADWFQYRGPNFDGSSPEKIVLSWPAEGPRQIWRRPVTGGFSSFVHTGDKLCTLALGNGAGLQMEACIALDADTGKESWSTELEIAKYTGFGEDSGNAGPPGQRGGDGPRSTPAMDHDCVYVVSSKLRLFCLSADRGEVIWTRSLVDEFDGTHIPYENAASPLLDGNRIFLAGGGPGQSLLCLDKRDGRVIWKAHDELLTHSTPTIATINNVRQLIFFTRGGLVAVNPEDGELLWRYKFRFRVSAAITPVVADPLVYCSAGYGVGSAVCRITNGAEGWSATEVWRKHHNEPICNYWSTPVHQGGYLYGIFGFKKYLIAPMKCVELATGAVKWSQPGFGHGNVVLVNGHLLALTGFGTLVLVKPMPDAYQEIARAKILTGKCWSTPIVSRGRIYARSTKEGVCLDVSLDRN